jgi:hypothetical protein
MTADTTRPGMPLIGLAFLRELNMTRLSHSNVRLSMSLLGAAAFAGVALGYAGSGVGGARAAAPSGNASPYYGRWQVDDSAARFTARGRLYKTIDIAPCGNDFCGVSVDESGGCGATLFRFLSIHSDGSSRLLGHGAWGSARKNVTIDYYEGDTPSEHKLELNLGDGHDFGERGGNMPMFNATYASRGAAQCRAR